jgi:lipopolysaccharide/colanic/teichoic acid biosynthesis glycosyltransferase
VADSWNVDELRERRIDAYRRGLDLIVSAALLLITLPVVLFVAVGCALSLRTSPIFTQDRVGRGGSLFRFLKIRTLPPEMPAYIDKHHLRQDAIPPFCRVVRRLHLDELPQLLLVLRGDMSLVGPRPEMAHLHSSMSASFAALRTSVRPGCTGLWQVSEACTDLIGACPEYDRAYLARRTLRLDLWVLMRTALKMVGIGRCVSLVDVPAWTLARHRGQGADVIDLSSAVLSADAAEGSGTLNLPAAAAGR